jgi:hypothetical protein
MSPPRRFLLDVLRRGLELDVMAADDLLEHVTPAVLAHHLPIALKAKLLQASLSAERMTPNLVVEVVGVEALAEHVPMPILWACVRACAARQLRGQVDDGLGATLGISAAASGGPIVPGQTQEMPEAVGLYDDLQLKPPRAARPSLRPGSTLPRISTLSPRSQVIRRAADASAQAAAAGLFEPGRPEESPDFEIVEETEVPSRPRASRAIEDETRPGTKP